jgi:hypothetical protein
MGHRCCFGGFPGTVGLGLEVRNEADEDGVAAGSGRTATGRHSGLTARRHDGLTARAGTQADGAGRHSGLSARLEDLASCARS